MTDEMRADYVSKRVPARARRQFQRDVSSVRQGRTNPAFKRNPKPPPFGGGAFTLKAQ
jgi:hypothetical protein